MGDQGSRKQKLIMGKDPKDVWEQGDRRERKRAWVGSRTLAGVSPICDA